VTFLTTCWCVMVASSFLPTIIYQGMGNDSNSVKIDLSQAWMAHVSTSTCEYMNALLLTELVIYFFFHLLPETSGSIYVRFFILVGARKP